MITRNEIMTDPTVHNLTKDILRWSENHDPLDRVNAVKLALDVLEGELDNLFKDVSMLECLEHVKV